MTYVFDLAEMFFATLFVSMQLGLNSVGFCLPPMSSDIPYMVGNISDVILLVITLDFGFA